MPIPVCYVNPLHLILSVDREFENFSGYSKIEIIGENIDKLFLNREEMTVVKKNIIDKKTVNNEKKIFLRKNNEKIPVIISAMTREDSDKNVIGYFISFIDISENDKYEEELRIQSEKLKNLDKLKNEFIANISHDFRSPLTSILNIADIELNYNKNLDITARENYDIIYKASLRLKSSIDKLLDLAKMDSQGIKLKIKKINLLSFVKKIMEYFSSYVMNSGIKIRGDFPENEINNFYSDSEKLEQIIDNIISNAIKFVDPRRGIITIAIVNDEHKVSIVISDNGIGISRDKLEVIFNRFERGHEGKNSLFSGTGIGLAFAKQLTDYLKGKIWAESEGEEKGARFFIEFKKGKNVFNENDFDEEVIRQSKREDIKKLIESEIEARMNEERITESLNELNSENEYDHKKGIILIIDDDRNAREIVLKYLKNNGYINFVVASDGKLGLEAMYKYSPDLVISDYNMPNMKGDEFHNEVTNNPKFKNVPFIFLSAIADENLIIERRKRGATAYLNKPIDEKLLVITVEENIKKHFDYLKMSQLAIVDELTGLNNRRAVLMSLNHEMAIRKYRDLSLLFLDIDHFKEINDLYGHQTGDKILSTVGKKIKASIRSYDIAGRYGGDEFIVILPDTNMEFAYKVAESLRKAIINTKIEHLDNQISVSTSIGVSSLKENAAYIEKELNLSSIENIYETRNTNKVNWNSLEKIKFQITELLLKMADIALYSAKQTACSKCNYSSEKAHTFFNNTCPKCSGNDLILGRNKVALFKS